MPKYFTNTEKKILPC